MREMHRRLKTPRMCAGVRVGIAPSIIHPLLLEGLGRIYKES